MPEQHSATFPRAARAAAWVGLAVAAVNLVLAVIDGVKPVHLASTVIVVVCLIIVLRELKNGREKTSEPTDTA